MLEKKLKVCLVMCNGDSQRFKDVGYNQEKYLLRHPRHESNIEAISKENSKKGYTTYIAIRDSVYKEISGGLDSFWPSGQESRVLELPKLSSHVESCTFAMTLLKTKLGGEVEVLIRDCDVLMELPDITSKRPSVLLTAKLPEKNDAHKNKGCLWFDQVNDRYIYMGKGGALKGSYICGGYWFRTLKDYFLGSDLTHSEMGNIKPAWGAEEVTEFEDIGEPKEWEAYVETFTTLFVDIDGCLFKSKSSKVKGFETPIPLQKNIDFINKMYASGRCNLIITTARMKKYHDLTVKQLDKHGIKRDLIIHGLYHGPRFLINDRKGDNITATGLCVPKDEDGSIEAFYNGEQNG